MAKTAIDAQGMQPDWREMNEAAGLLSAEDCRHCSGMGRVPVSVSCIGAMPLARCGVCPECGGTGKKMATP